jgi:hypothetical protein
VAWIASHQQMRTDPLVGRLARKLAIGRAQALGHLHLLWWWCIDHAPNGDLSPFEPEDVAEAAEWEGDPEVFVAGLRESGWLVEGKIAGWEQRAGALMSHRQRQQRYRARLQAGNGRHSDVTDTYKEDSTEQYSKRDSMDPSAQGAEGSSSSFFSGNRKAARGRRAVTGELDVQKYLTGKYARFFAADRGVEPEAADLPEASPPQEQATHPAAQGSSAGIT